MTVQFRDVTDRKRAEERERRAAAAAAEAAEANAKFRTFFEQGTQFAGLMATDGTVVEANRLCLDACGYTRDDVIGRKFWECGWWARSPDLVDMVKIGSATAAAGQVFRRESPYFMADGSRRVVDLTIAPVSDATGRILFVAPTGTDVTDRARAEAAVRFLADASASLAELVDYESTLGRIASLAVGRFADWCIVDVLDAAGERKRLVVTGPEAKAYASDDLAVGIPHVLRTGEPELVPDLAALDPETSSLGADRIARLTAWGLHSYLSVPLVSRTRVIGGMTFLSASPDRRFGETELGVATDLAGRVTVAIENAQLYRTMQEQDRRKDEFLATLAHELRNPLAPVRNGGQILRASLPVEETTERVLGMMDCQLGHMVHLVDDLMDVAQVSSGKVVLRKERIELKPVVEAAVESTRQAVEAGGHALVIDIPAEPMVFDGDRTRLVQVLANLLSNAAKYTTQGGRIVLAATRSNGHAVVRVADTGIGIAADMLPKVFEMFTQVGTSLERSQGGLGIGLTLVKRLVEMHGGTGTAESPGPVKGSTFTVRLPLSPEVTPDRDPVPQVGIPPASRLSILVVDDNVDAAESLGMLLQLKGHEVRMTHDGPEALRILEAYRPHLVLLDIGLPGMTGYEVARRIRESTGLRGVTLAALTGWGQEEDRKWSREAGFDYHLSKPADPSQVERILGEVGKSRLGG